MLHHSIVRATTELHESDPTRRNHHRNRMVFEMEEPSRPRAINDMSERERPEQGRSNIPGDAEHDKVGDRRSMIVDKT